MNMSVYAVETRNLVKHYNKGKVKAVNGLDLRIKKGEIYARSPLLVIVLMCS